MKLAISNIAWDVSENDHIKDILLELNVHAIEIAPTKFWDNPLAATEASIQQHKSYWNDSNIEIIAMQSMLFNQPNLTIFDSTEASNNTLTYLEKIIELGAALGVKAFVFGSPKNRQVGQLTPEKYEHAVHFFTRLGEIALKNDTTFCIEPNPAIYNCDFINNTKEAVELIQKVNHPGFQLHLDAAALLLNEENIEEAITLAAPYLKHFHISEPYLNEIKEAKGNHELIANSLRKIDYSNFISIEMKQIDPTSNFEIVKENLQFVKDMYHV